MWFVWIDANTNPLSTRRTLRNTWSGSSGSWACPRRKYLTAVIADWLEASEAHQELVIGRADYNPSARAQLLAMSSATIDRYLKAERDRLRLKGISTTKPGTLLRNSITVRKAGDELEAETRVF